MAQNQGGPLLYGGAMVLALGVLLCPPAQARAEGIGACAWARAAEGGERDRFLAAFAQSPQAGTAQLNAADAKLLGYVSGCARRADLPRHWARMAVASVALQDGAAASLQRSSRITRPALDAAWMRAPQAARDCARENAAKVIGATGPACPDRGAPGWFLRHFRIAPETDRASAGAVLFFMNAKAQEEWAESLIARFPQRPAP